MSVIEVNNLTKSYEFGKGIFDVTFNVDSGEVVGFLGPNGAGKSTTMRHLMGFSIPDSGECKINGYDCAKEYYITKKNIGYLPGEPTLPQGLDGKAFVKMMEGLKECHNDKLVESLCNRFELDLNQDIKKMSIGERRKLAVVTAFMSDPDVLLLDEPTSGLDPRMQEIFIEFIEEEKKRGKTILLSSHIFREVERLCDRIMIIKDGRIVASVSKDDISKGLKKTFEISFYNLASYESFSKLNYDFSEKNREKLKVSIKLNNDSIDGFIKTIKNYNVKSFNEITMTLEDYFMKFYKTRGDYLE